MTNKVEVTSVVDNISFAGKSNTTVQLPIAINYTMTEAPSLSEITNDPVLAVLAQACGIPGLQERTPGAKIRMKIVALIDLKIISWTGKKIEQDRDVAFDCPDSISSALGGVFSGKGPIAAVVSAVEDAARNGNPVPDLLGAITNR